MSIATTHALRWLPGRSPAARVLFGWHLCLFLLGTWYLLAHRDPGPWNVDVGARLPEMRVIIPHGLWRGATVHVLLSLAMMLSVRWWGAGSHRDGELDATGTSHCRKLPRGFIVVLLLIVGIGLWLRLPRMTQSFWGDEGWSIRPYVYGFFKPLAGDNFQGPLRFVPRSWLYTLMADTTGGNHFLFSACQRLCLESWRTIGGLPETALSEWVSRLPALVPGMLTLPLLGCFLAWLGLPRAGLISALLLAVHPWHVCYSTEARGYALMFFFLLATVWLMALAIRHGRWRWWILMGVAEFCCVYSWKMSVIPLFVLNGVHAMRELSVGRNADRRLVLLKRATAVHVTAAAAFLTLSMASSLTSAQILRHLTFLAKPMDAGWLKDSASGVLLGVPWQASSLPNPLRLPLADRLHSAPLATSLFIGGDLLLTGIGLASLFRHRPRHAAIFLLIPIGMALSAAVFKWVLHIEWLYWYFFPLVLSVVVLKAVGLDRAWASVKQHGGSFRWREGASAVLATVVALGSFSLSWPKLAVMRDHPREANREVYALTRGRHEPFGYAGPSNVVTRYHQRHIDLYDPRVDLRVSTPDALKETMTRVDLQGHHLYYVVGWRESASPGLMALLRDPALFEPLGIFYAEDDINTLEAFRYLGAAASSR